MCFRVGAVKSVFGGVSFQAIRSRLASCCASILVDNDKVGGFTGHGSTDVGMVSVTLMRGKTVVVFKDVPAQVCPNCREYYLESDVSKKLMERASTAVDLGDRSRNCSVRCLVWHLLKTNFCRSACVISSLSYSLGRFWWRVGT